MYLQCLIQLLIKLLIKRRHVRKFQDNKSTRCLLGIELPLKWSKKYRCYHGQSSLGNNANNTKTNRQRKQRGKICRKRAPLLELAPDCRTVNNDKAQEWKKHGERQRPTTQSRAGKTKKTQKVTV